MKIQCASACRCCQAILINDLYPCLKAVFSPIRSIPLRWDLPHNRQATRKRPLRLLMRRIILRSANLRGASTNSFSFQERNPTWISPRNFTAPRKLIDSKGENKKGLQPATPFSEVLRPELEGNGSNCKNKNKGAAFWIYFTPQILNAQSRNNCSCSFIFQMQI